MAKEVIKKDGTKEPFDAEKIKKAIAAAAQTTDVTEERRNEVIGQVTAKVVQIADAKEEIATSEIKEAILTELDNVEPSISAAWRKHEEEKGAGGEAGVAEGTEEEEEKPTV